MKSFGQWLAEIELDRYAEIFSANRIDLDVIATLTEADLRELGVALGDRKRLIQAIADLTGRPLAEPLPVPIAAVTTSLLRPAEAGESTGERRQLTVMFCDLVGSTALSEKLDPEELRSLLHNYRTVCGEVITRYEGFVARYVGDGILTYFGWPKAHEEDAERALRAALEIVQTVKHASTSEALSVRIGIATGPVVIGEQAGVGEQSKLAIGSTPNLAARLQGLAAADQIVIASSTRRLVGNAFELADLGEHDLKGIAEPVHAWRVMAVSEAASRFEASHGAHVTPLVGREQEIGLLMERWALAQEGEGQVVLLSGEPGIGKSRILNTLREWSEDQSVGTLRFQCSPYYVNSAFYPTIDNFERTLRFARDEVADAKLDKLEALMVTQYGRPIEDVRFTASLLSIPYEERYSALTMTPQKFKDETLRTLVDLTEAAARKQPTVMLFEDAHWADPTSLEVMDLLIDRVRTIPLLIVLTHRPEFQSRWSQHGHVLALNLSKLTRAQSGAIVSELTSGKALPAELLEQILNKTDGVPLFVEELTRNILESGYLTEHNDRYTINSTLPALAIPASLQDSLMARLDRLGSTKEIAQIGACIGREFSHEILAAVSPHSSADLERDVQRLVESGLVGRHGHGALAAYTFKHALVQDAAYQSLLKSRRKTIHQDIARVLQARFAEQIQSKPELLALHLAQAGLIDEAVPQWLAAARLAAKGTRYREAQSHVDSALAIVTLLPDAVRANVEVSLLVTGAFCRFAIEGYASESAARMLARVEEVLDHVTDTNTLDIALWAIGVHAWVRGNLRKALATYERLTALAEKTGEIDRMVFAYFCLGTALNNVAQFARGYRLLEFVIEKYETERHGKFVYAIGQDLKTSTSSFIGMIRLWSGRANDARHYSQLSITHSEAIAHPFSLAMALSFASLVLAEMGECEDAIRLSNRCIELSELQNLPQWRAWAIFAEGVALVRQGYYDRGLANLNQTSQIFQAMGQQTGSAWIRAWQAIALAHLGRFADARRQADLGIQSCHETGEILHLPWVLHARGIAEQLDTNAETATAEYWLNEALAEARSHDNRWLELRVAYSLAGLWRSQGKRKEALELLKPVYEWFTEGFDTKDLIEAKALLEELA